LQVARRHELKHVIGLAIALALTWMIFFGAGYFGAVWTHYFSDEPEQKSTGEVSIKVLPNPTAGNGLCDPHTGRCSSTPSGSAPKPHE
jgi:hypothetical protein